MIQKKLGLFLLEKLRNIHLFEADYNWILGFVFGRRMVYTVQKLRSNYQMAKGAHGQDNPQNNQSSTRLCLINTPKAHKDTT